MQDVTPPDRSIRNIPVPPGRKRMPTADLAVPREGTRPRPSGASRPDLRRSGTSLWLWILAALVVAVLAGFLISALFEGARITVFPKTETVTLDTTLSAYPDAPIGSLPYQTMRLTRSVTRTIPATGEAPVERRASGTAVIENAYSTASQRLIKNTRFEAPDGKIYRIDESVVVPGTTKAADGSLVPGTVDVILFADSPGPEYNRGDTTFTIPGFKGDPRYDKFRARTQGEITGGFVGTEKIVAESALATAREDMQQELAELIEDASRTEIPEGFLLIPGTTKLTFKDQPRESGEGGNAIVGLEVVATAAMVRERDLAGAVAKATLPSYGGEAVLFKDREAITIEVAEAADVLGEDPIAMALSGNPVLVWQFDAESLKVELAGKDRVAFESIIRSYQPEISRAEASIRPFFKNAFPTDPEDVIIEVAEER